MNDFYAKLANILEVDTVTPTDILTEFEEWDSLTVLMIVSMLNMDYGISLTAAEMKKFVTASDLAVLTEA